MLKLLLSLSALVSFSSTLQAREAVITFMRVETNSVISDPSLMKVKITGSLAAQAENCESTRAVATLEQAEVDGKLILTPMVTLSEELADKACASPQEDSGTVALRATLILKKDDLSRVVLLNSPRLGDRTEGAALFENSFVPFPLAETCEDLARPESGCVDSRTPTNCKFENFEVSAGTFCAARHNLMRAVCGAGVIFEMKKMECKAKAGPGGRRLRMDDLN